MKHLFLTIAFCLSAILAVAQTNVEEIRPQFYQNPNAEYWLYPTRNMWAYIELDTRSGMMWVVAYSVNGLPVRRTLSYRVLIDSNDELKPGRFALFATTNMWNFILIDTKTGKTYQVQWSTDGKSDMVVPIV